MAMSPSQYEIIMLHSHELVGHKSSAHHSVLISDSNIDNTMTLCRLRRPSGHPLDYT
jgi:hypothetical protein